jgi:hypothetical protein
MAGTFIVNLVFSLLGFFLFFSLSYSKYYPFETLMNSLVVGFIFWLSGYLVRYLFGKSLQTYSKERFLHKSQSLSTAEEPTKASNQPLSEDEIEHVSKYIQDLINKK